MSEAHPDVPLASRLAQLVARQARPESGAWLAEQVAALRRVAGAPDAVGSALGPAMAAAGRRLGAAALALGDGDVLDEYARLLVAGRGLDEVGRMALLLAAAQPASPEVRRALISDAFYRGDAREKHAALRVIPLLPDPASLADLGVEACRSHVQTVFEAIACENPLPADHFSEGAFNQMVLKSLFTGVSVERISGLSRRVGADLVRMSGDYAAERRAAGRVVPDGIQHISNLFDLAQLARSAS